MLGDNTAVHIEELTDGLLRQPDIVVLHTDFDALLMGVFRKDKKIHCAVANLQLVFWHLASPPPAFQYSIPHPESRE